MLTRITVASAQRRVDVVLPDEVPLAELLPDLVQRAGEGLADEGQQHGGWALHRFGGVRIEATDSMASAGVADGEVLHLVPARTAWPEPEYDDVVDAIAVRARQLGARWTGDATRVAAVLTAGLLLVAGLLTQVDGTDPWAVLGVAVVLLGAGVLAVRAWREPLAGTALAAYALLPAFAAGWYLPGPAAPTASRLLVAATAVTLWAVAGALGVTVRLWIFVAAGVAGGFGAVAASAALATDGARAAALLMIVVVAGVTLAPSAAIRLGRLPLPVVALPGGSSDTGALAHRPDVAGVRAAVERTDAVLTGLLIGSAGAGIGAGLALVGAGTAGPLLTTVAGVALALRARLFVTVRQRAPLLVAGLVLGLLPLWTGAWSLGRLAAPLMALVVVGVTLSGVRYRLRAPSPYLGRVADLADTVCLVSLVPIAAAVLDLYAKMRGLAG